MSKNSKKLKHQIGLLLGAGLIVAAVAYGLMGRSNKVYAPQDEGRDAQTVSPLGDAKGASCGIAPKGVSAGGCGMMGTSQKQATTSSPSPEAYRTESAEEKTMIPMNYEQSGLEPSTINVEAGKSYTILINVKTDVVGCMNTINIPGLDENMQNVNKGSTLVFHIKPTSAGTYEFKCAMGLSHGAKIVVK